MASTSETMQYTPFDENRYLQISSIVPRLKKIPTEVTRVVDWGRLRLFLMTLNFFNRYVLTTREDVRETICVYAGAAPGMSISTLILFYPWVKYHLYDPMGNSTDEHLSFHKSLRQNRAVELYDREFTDEDADFWEKYIIENPNSRVYFISDIRRTTYPSKPKKDSAESEEDFRVRFDETMKKRELIIQEEMEMQQKWTQIMKPHAALLKFRPPTGKDSYTYLDGFIFRGVYGDIDSLENFLIPTDNVTTRDYNIREYEEVVNYHNYVFRKFSFLNILDGTKSPIAPNLGLTNNYDSTVFVKIIRDYLEGFKREGEKISNILKLIDSVTRILGEVGEDGRNPLAKKVNPRKK